MAIIELTEESFDATVSAKGVVLVDCWAQWCAACKTFAPIYQKVASRYPAHVFGKLDSQAERALVSSLGIEHIPSLLVYRDGVLLFQQPGNFDEETLETIVSQAESIDIDAVRAQVAADQAESGGA